MLSLEYLRSFRLFNIALFDLVATFIAIFALQNYIWFHPLDKPDRDRDIVQYISFTIIMLITSIGIGIISHWLFNVRSALSAYIGINNMPVR